MVLHSSSFFSLQDVSNVLPFGAPPILPRLKSKVQYFLENPQLLPIHDFRLVQQHWKEETDIGKICRAEIAPVPTTLVVLQKNAGQRCETMEIATAQGKLTNKTSVSLQRTPGMLIAQHLACNPITLINLKVLLMNGCAAMRATFPSGPVAWTGVRPLCPNPSEEEETCCWRN